MSIKAIKKDTSTRFYIETKNTSYILEAAYGFDEYKWGNREGFLNNLYWGKRLSNPDEVTYIGYDNGASHRINRGRLFDEYPAYGGLFYDNESLKITFADGVRETVLKYSDYELSDDGTELTIVLKDEYYPLSVKLFYKIYEELDLIDRHTEIINGTDGKITLETFDSAAWTLPYREKNYQLTYMAGGMIHEYEIEKCEIGGSTVTLQSKSGKSNTHNFPYFAIDDYTATEHSGEVYFGTLQWSGNWKINIGRDTVKITKITGGISPFDCNVVLEPGESFKTPIFTGGFVAEGFGAASRRLHDYQRKTTLCRHINKVMPMIYNSWCTLGFNIDQEVLFAQAKRAKDLGMELFAVDDGWFGERNDDASALGDWYPNPQKFPQGLKPVVDYVNSLGLKFGIWIEPEMVSPNSNLYREHPEWVMNYPTRRRETARNQLTLNFAREDVYQFTEKWVDELLSSCNIEYLKFDMNRYLSQAGWPEAEKDKQKSIWIKYVTNFYRLMEFINKKYPHVIIENCAEGGTRSDMSMSRWCGRINRSDNQDPVDVLQLHEGFTKVNLPKTAGGGAHFHHMPSYMNGRSPSYKFMAFAGFNGSLSCGLDLRRLNQDELDEIRDYVAFYKQIRETVQLGDMYVLNSAFDKNAKSVAFQYVSKDKKKSVILVYANNVGFKSWIPPIMPKGLDINKTYHVNTYKSRWTLDTTLSGDTLMNRGIYSSEMGFFDATYDAFAILLEEK